MRSDRRVVVSTPLPELWDKSGVVSDTKVRDLGVGDIVDLLRRSRVRFVVANVGHQLHWVLPDDCYEFWKTEVKMRVAEPSANGINLEHFPEAYFYFASEWESDTE